MTVIDKGREYTKKQVQTNKGGGGEKKQKTERENPNKKKGNVTKKEIQAKSNLYFQLKNQTKIMT